MSDFVARNVTILDFSNPRNIQLPEVYQPQSCIIKFKNLSMDVGANCYALRELRKKINNQGNFVSRVVMQSLDQGRIPLLRKSIEYAAYLTTYFSSVASIGRVRRILAFLKFYFNQSDLDYFQPQNRMHFEEAAKRFSAVLRADKKIATVTKYIYTNEVFHFAQFIYDMEHLNAFDYDIIPNTDQKKSGTTPLLPEELELSLALRTAIFEGVFDLLVNNRKLPYRLKVPAACGELNDAIWLGYAPWKGPCCFPRAADFEKNQPKEWFNRDTGELVTKTQWLERAYHKCNINALRSWYSAQSCLRLNNRDHSNLKTTLVEHASQCFLDLLLSMTGMNQQPALDLPWHGGYFVQKAKQGNKTVTLVRPEDQCKLEKEDNPNLYLRSIKNRKRYQPVEVTISNRFLPQFKRYLQLREYYLNGRTDARLFPFSNSLIVSKRHSLQTRFPEVSKLGVFKARASVSNSILTTTDDPNVAAQVLQNAPQTIMKHYAAGTQKSHIQGMGNFFSSLGNQIKATRLATTNEVVTAVGSCDNGGENPEPLSNAPIEANCIQQEGCFFCRHYCVHADEIDIRKLVSVLYYISKGATRSHDVNFFNEIFQLLIERIKDLLEQIEAISIKKKELVTRIKEEVFTEEALDEYWLAKLNRLERLVGAY